MMKSPNSLPSLLLAVGLLAQGAVAEGGADPARDRSLPALPVAIASFGAAATADGLYVYGGHVGGTHQHSVQNLSTGFWGLDLNDAESGWRDLGKVRGLQGLPMVAYGDSVCRVGGMEALNQKGDEEDMYSIAEVDCYDTVRGRWSALPPLPAGRSSHDAVVHGDHLYVVGGWQLRGEGEEPVWRDTIDILDLASPEPSWRSVPQPFRRRALSVAALNGKVYVFGGLGERGTSRAVAVFDVASEEWSDGPELPRSAGPMRGFGVSAFAVGEVIYLSGGDGAIHRLEPGSGWQRDVGTLRTQRFFHRLVPHGDRLFFVAGASRETHLASVEVVDESELGQAAEPVAERAGDGRAASAVDSWPGFRGRGDSRDGSSEPPLHWSDDSNLLWRARLPGYGQAAPVVWGRQVFVTSIEGPNKEELILSALDFETGTVRWRRRFEASQKVPASDMVSRGAPTPAVDSETVFAFWESGDLIALDHDGTVRWRRSLTDEYGEFRGNHGVASSPILVDDLVIQQITHGGPSYYVAIDKESGVNRWRVDREAGPAWTTPVVVETPAGAEIVTSAAGRVEGLDVETGEQRWLFTAIEGNRVPSVAVDGEMVVAASSAADQNLALPRRLEGAVDESEVAWRAAGVTSGFGSPLIHGDCVLFVNKAGVATCVDRGSGEEIWQHRLADACWASPVATRDLVFFFTKGGRTTVLRHGPGGPKVVAENTLGLAGTVYGVAAARDSFVIRTGSEIARVGRATESAPDVTEADVAARLETGGR